MSDASSAELVPLSSDVPSYVSDGRPSFREALLDVLDGLKLWRVWLTLSWHDIRQRYRGSVLGPLWLTLNTGIMVAALGLLYGTILKATMHEYMPYLAIGLVIWHLIQGLVLEGNTCFIQSEGFIKQMRLPLSLFAFRLVSRNFITFAHNVLVYVIVAILFGLSLTPAALLALPALALVLINGFFGALFTGTICARLRDVPQIIASLLQILFFVTPIIWNPDLVATHPFVVNLNPLYFMIEILRAPLLGQPVTATVWIGALTVTALNVSLSLAAFARLRHRVAFWV